MRQRLSPPHTRPYHLPAHAFLMPCIVLACLLSLPILPSSTFSTVPFLLLYLCCNFILSISHHTACHLPSLLSIFGDGTWGMQTPLSMKTFVVACEWRRQAVGWREGLEQGQAGAEGGEGGWRLGAGGRDRAGTCHLKPGIWRRDREDVTGLHSCFLLSLLRFCAPYSAFPAKPCSPSRVLFPLALSRLPPVIRLRLDGQAVGTPSSLSRRRLCSAAFICHDAGRRKQAFYTNLPTSHHQSVFLGDLSDSASLLPLSAL